jgi:hypothetical protein
LEGHPEDWVKCAMLKNEVWYVVCASCYYYHVHHTTTLATEEGIEKVGSPGSLPLQALNCRYSPVICTWTSTHKHTYPIRASVLLLTKSLSPTRTFSFVLLAPPTIPASVKCLCQLGPFLPIYFVPNPVLPSLNLLHAPFPLYSYCSIFYHLRHKLSWLVSFPWVSHIPWLQL